ncbi:MAG: HAD family phosphatase, partial [Gimesia chilikensis]
CVIITATNSFITTPITRHYGVDTLLATDAEEVNGFLTGRIAGVPCFQDGKVKKLRQWLTASGSSLSLDNSVFYSDSRNDIPLLELVSEAVAVDPDPKLRQTAQQKGWRIMSLRG